MLPSKTRREVTHGSSQHVKHECSQTPPVDGLAMSTAHQNLRGPVAMQRIIILLHNVNVIILGDNVIIYIIIIYHDDDDTPLMAISKIT